MTTPTKRDVSPLLLAIRKLVPSIKGRAYTTHYKEGGMRCKLHGASLQGLGCAWLKGVLEAAGFVNVSVIRGGLVDRGPQWRSPYLTILASQVGEKLTPKSPVLRELQRASAPAADPKPLVGSTPAHLICLCISPKQRAVLKMALDALGEAVAADVTHLQKAEQKALDELSQAFSGNLLTNGLMNNLTTL